jgi:hypothetical protein
MKYSSNLRTGMAVCILAFFSFYQLFQSINYYNPLILFNKLRTYGQLPPDSVTKYTEKLDCLKADLSPLETVGFITNNVGEAFPTETYLLTQYAIAPVLLKNTADTQTVIGYFSHGIDRKILSQAGLVLVKTCNQGIVLARRR